MDTPPTPQQAQGMPVQPTPSSPSQIPQQFPMVGGMMQQPGAPFMARGPYPGVRPQMMPHYPMAPAAFVPAPGYIARGVPPQYSMGFAGAPMPHVPGQPMMQPIPRGAMMPAPQMPMQPQTPQQPYVKREKKPLIILDPKTKTPIELPAAKPKAVASPALTPAQAPVFQSAPVPVSPAETISTPPVQAPRPSAAAEEMRQKVLAAKTGASPSPALINQAAKVESQNLKQQMPEVQLPRAAETVKPEIHSLNQQKAPEMPRAEVRTESAHPVPAPTTAPVPATVKAPQDGVPPPLAAPPGLATTGETPEEARARAKRNMEEKQRQKEAFDQKLKQEDEAAKRAAAAAAAPPAAPVETSGISFPVPPVQQPSPSPTNKGTRLVYSREQLATFRNAESSSRPPDDLHPDFQDYQPRPRHRPTPVRRDNVAAPPRVSGGPPQASEWRKGPGGQQQQASGVAPVVPPLQTSQNAWKRTQPTSEHEAALRNIRSILNRLAKDNFPVLSKEILSIPITSLTMLEDMVRAIFDKALLEPPFGPVYAQLCREISDKSKDQLWEFVKAVKKETGWFWSSTLDINAENALNGQQGTDKGYATEQDALDAARKGTTFKRLLLTECQKEFESNNYEEVDEEEKQLRASMDMTTDEAKQKLQVIEMKRRKIKKRVLGNMAFIGELYLKEMLSVKIINTCIVMLLSEEAINNTEAFFESEKKFTVDPENVESICKLFQTIGSKLEQDNKDLLSQYFKFLTLLEQFYAKSDRPELRTSRQRFMIKDLIDLRKARWHDARQAPKAATKEESRLKSLEQDASRSAGGGRGGYSGGGSGGAAPLSRNQPSSARFQGGATTSVPRAGVTGRFAQGATATTGGKSGPVVAGAPRVAGVPTISSVRVVGAPAKAPTPPPDAKPSTPSPATPIANAITEDNLKKAYGSALEEYVANKDAVEIANEFKGLFQRFEASKAKRILITIIAERVSERKEDERKALIQLLPLLVKDHAVVSAQDVVEALQDYLEFFNDLLIDSPKAGEHMAKLLDSCLQTSALSYDDIRTSMDKLRGESPEGEETLLKELKKLLSPEAAQRLDAAANCECGESSSSSSSWTDAFILLVNQKKPDNELVQFLARCPQDEVASRGPEMFERIFEVKALSESEANIAVTSKVNALRRLVQNGSNQRLAQSKAIGILTALSRKHGHPSGFFNGLLDALYRNDVIFEDAVDTWRSGASKEDLEVASEFLKYLAEAAAEASDQ